MTQVGCPLEVHIVEPGGIGGVFQHSLALGSALAQRGLRVTIHTADDHEKAEARDGLSICGCVAWLRSERPGPLRSLRIAVRYLKTVFHLVRCTRRGGILHFQGVFKPQLTLATLMAAKSCGAATVYSPHNTFMRYRSDSGQRCLIWAIRMADAVVVFSAWDAERVLRMRADVVRTDLLMLSPKVTLEAIRALRSGWGIGTQGRSAIMLCGQVRPDKLPELLVDAVAKLPDALLVVAGEDLGAAEGLRQRASEVGVEVCWDLRYLPMSDFATTVAAADAVVCLYAQASQSGVLSLARTYGVPTVSTDVGGLSELADVVVDEVTALSIARGVRDALAMPRRTWTDESTCMQDHKSVYKGLAG